MKRNFKFLIDGKEEIKKYITNFKKGKNNLKFLDVGGREGKNKILYHGCELNILEIYKEVKHPKIIYGDICNCPQIQDESYDIVYSTSVFEHIKEPWKAAKECVRVTKTGGINVHLTLFAWRYHAVPVDCFRYTHTGMRILFEQSNNMKELLTGYDITKRRKKKGNGRIEGLNVPTDDLGGWRENWSILYIGQKI